MQTSWIVVDTVIHLTGLIPFLNYTLLVTSENEVSQFDERIIFRSVLRDTTTLEGGQSMTLYICMRK